MDRSERTFDDKWSENLNNVSVNKTLNFNKNEETQYLSPGKGVSRENVFGQLKDGCMTDRENIIDWNEIEKLNKIPWLFYEMERSGAGMMQDGHYLSKFCRYYQDLKQAADYVC